MGCFACRRGVARLLALLVMLHATNWWRPWRRQAADSVLRRVRFGSARFCYSRVLLIILNSLLYPPIPLHTHLNLI